MQSQIKSRTTGIVLLLFAANRFATGASLAVSVIPAPSNAEQREGSFWLRPDNRILADADSQATAKLLAQRLRPATGFALKIRSAKSDVADGDILLTTNRANPALGSDGYELSVTTNTVIIRAPGQAGVFYGVQSLEQLLPPETFAAKPAQSAAWRIPCVQITDQPRFKWRGLMLDVSRHFFSKAEVERVLDMMARYKLNTFHWHLVDDQGWRLEIKKYPKLTELGAWRAGIGFGLDPKAANAYRKDGRYGGFYAQRDIREVVAYAAARHITIVPEIEMPGHSTAALMAYPEYSCTGGPFSTDINGGVFNGVYCAGNDAAFAFLEDVLSEVFELFPGRYVHIGGDEVRKENWQKCAKCQQRIRQEGLKNEHELQSYFIRRIEKFIASRGRTLIGWSEIREGGLAQNAAVMDWIGGAVDSAGSGHDVVMSPTAWCYFDHYQSTDHATEAKAIGGFLPLEKVYEFEPIPARLAPEFQSHILGAQANLWTEYVPSLRHAEYMLFPRLCALAEVVWSPQTARNWDSFCARIAVNETRLEYFGANFRHIAAQSQPANPK